MNKILFYDIERTPLIGTSWTKWEPAEVNVIKDWEILSIAYKWEGNDEVWCHSRIQYPSEKELVQKFHEVYNSADIIVTHNGKRFDNKCLNSKIIEHQLPALEYRGQIDTLEHARKIALFSSNSLDELAKKFGLEPKIKMNDKMGTWHRAFLPGIPEKDKHEALTAIEEYNRHDVVLLEQVFARLRPYLSNIPNLSQLGNDGKGCPSCGKVDKLFSKGIFITGGVNPKQNWLCKGCNYMFSKPNSWLPEK